MLRKNNRGIIGLAIVAIAVLAFLFFVGKRIYDANFGDKSTAMVATYQT